MYIKRNQMDSFIKNTANILCKNYPSDLYKKKELHFLIWRDLREDFADLFEENSPAGLGFDRKKFIEECKHK